MSTPTRKPRKVKGPYFSPDIGWDPMTQSSAVPEEAFYTSGELNGSKVYVGRVNDGTCVYVGTAVPDKGVCLYVDKKQQLQSSTEYEILSIRFGDHLVFEEGSSVDRERYNQVVAGIDENGEVLYVGRHIDTKNNTYYGWLLKDFKNIHIPRDPSLGPQVLDDSFSVLIHTHIHMMCTGCPVPEEDMSDEEF